MSATVAAGGPPHPPSTANTVQGRGRSDKQPECVLIEPPEQLLRALGAVLDERIARERWQREARRLEALRFQTGTSRHAAPTSCGAVTTSGHLRPGRASVASAAGHPVHDPTLACSPGVGVDDHIRARLRRVVGGADSFAARTAKARRLHPRSSGVAGTEAQAALSRKITRVIFPGPIDRSS
jgi:hypothetical protein